MLSNGNGRPVARGRRDCGRSLGSDLVHPDGTRDVLQVLLAQGLEVAVHLALQVVVNRVGDQNATWRAEPLEAGRDVDSVAEEILPLDHDVAQIDPDPEHDASLGRHLGLALVGPLLDGDRTGHSIDH